MNDPRDHELSRIYREGAWPEPRRQLDDAILEASRRAARARRSASFVWRWGPRFALAATVVLTFSLLLRMSEEMPGEKIAPLLTPAARRAPPAAPRPARPVEEAKPLAEIATPKSEPAPPRGLVEEPPPTLQSAPAAPAFALKKEAPEAARADALQRGSDIQQNSRLREAALPPRELQPAPARPAPPPIAAPTAQAPGAAVTSGLATSLAARAPGVAERSPQAWLDDIRKLKAQGKTEDAQRELAEFRKRYPDYRLPDDLR